MVTEGIILCWIENLKKCSRRIPLVISCHLINLIQQEHWIAGANLFQSSENTARHSTYVGTAMASYFCFIPYTA